MPTDDKFVAASDTIENSPHSALTRVIEAGFELWYQTEDDELTIRVTLAGNHIGYANFEGGDRNADIQNIWVEPNSRQSGVGGAICALAVKLLNKPLRNIWNEEEILQAARLKGELDAESFCEFWRRLQLSYPELFE
ncbi:MAG: hypothetical protein SWH78_15785 [Thermodesulfobacteriota bacterium]|nr:hypothetical protein [Thermodesulfobacteriota bacterium]